MAYLLDADVFIRAKNLHYGLDFCPAFWEWLVIQNAAERLFSIEKVGDEIHAVADELSVWAAARGQGFFLRPDATVFPALAAVSTWAGGQRCSADGPGASRVSESFTGFSPRPPAFALSYLRVGVLTAK